MHSNVSKMSTQIITFAKETKSKKLLFQELPYHGVNIIFYTHSQVLKSKVLYTCICAFLLYSLNNFSVSSREI